MDQMSLRDKGNSEATATKRSRLPKVVVKDILIPIFVGVAVTLLGNFFISPISNDSHKPIYTYDAARPNPPVQDSAKTAKIRQLLIRKWLVEDSSNPFRSIRGELEVEFTDQGTIIRTIRTLYYWTTSQSYTYDVSENGELKSDADLKLLKLSEGQLILSWGKKVTHYTKDTYWWELVRIFTGVVVGLLVFGVIRWGK